MDWKALVTSLIAVAVIGAIGIWLISLGKKAKPFGKFVFAGLGSLVILIGVSLGFSLYGGSVQENASTLFETEISSGPASFTVEHPNSLHALQIWPVPDPSSMTAEAQIAVNIVDAKGNVLLDTQQSFSPHAVGSSTRSNYDWNTAEAQSFTPTQSGAVTIRVTPSGDTEKVHLWIKDPDKTDGKRY